MEPLAPASGISGAPWLNFSLFLKEYPRVLGNLRPNSTYSAERPLQSLEILARSSAPQIVELARHDGRHQVLEPLREHGCQTSTIVSCLG